MFSNDLLKLNHRFLTLVVCFIFFGLTGCKSTNKEQAIEPKPIPKTEDVVEFSHANLTKDDSFNSDQIDELLNQPFIDPLTRFIQRNKNKKDQVEEIKAISKEIDKRCQSVAKRVSTRSQSLEQKKRFTRAYRFSCPAQVAQIEATDLSSAAFEVVQEETNSAKLNQVEKTQLPPKESLVSRRNISEEAADCYLLLSIKNYSEAHSVCLPFAEQGDAKAIEGIARINYLKEEYYSFSFWAKKVADESADMSFLMGQIYELGRSVGRSRDEAKNWYLQAAELGHPDASSALNRISTLSN